MVLGLAGAAALGGPAGLPPISAGGGTSGDAISGSSGINIGGLFSSTGGRSARMNDNIVPIVVVGIALLAGVFFLTRR